MAESNVSNVSAQIVKASITNHNNEEFDIKEVFLNIEIYEDIFSPYLTSKLVIVDTIDFCKQVPIVGGETVTLSFRMREEDEFKTFEFVIYKKETSINNDLKKQIIIFHLCSEECLVNEQKIISTKLKSSTRSNIQQCLAVLGTSKSFESDISDSIEYYANFKSPFETIKDMTVLTDTLGLFYEDINGYKYKNLASLMQSTPTEIYFDKNDIEKQSDVNNIKQYKFTQEFNLLLGYKNSIFGTTEYNLDDTNYSINKIEQTYANSQVALLGKNIPYNSSLLSTDNNVSSRRFNSESRLTRFMFLNTMVDRNLILKLNGITTRNVGDTLFIKQFPNKDNVSQYHEMYSGKWFILQVKHMINNLGTYEQNINIVKNGFFKLEKDGITPEVIS